VVIAMEQGQVLHRFMLTSGTWALASDEAMVSSIFAKENKLDIGEPLLLATSLGNLTVEITATVDDMIGDIFVDRSALEPLLGEELLIGTYVKVAPGSTDQVKEDYLTSFLVADVQRKEGISSGMLDLMGSYYDIILIFGLVSVTISAIAIANIIYVSVLERSTEYGQLRALGYQKRQVGRSVYLEVLILVCIGALVSIPLLFLVLESMVDIYKEFFPVYRNILYITDWGGYLLIVVMTFAMALLAAWPAIRTVGRMDVVKSVTGGRFG
jgi:ABC-type antimicrobial peptide transport system permease subunit